MYKLTMPENIVFGNGALEKLGSLMPAGVRTLIVSGRSAVKNGTVDRIAALLAPESVKVFGEVDPEPTIQQVDEVRRCCREFGAAAVVAVGGGSALDVGKVAAAAGKSEIPTAEYFFNRAMLPEQGLFMAALPTTAGTGAEVTPNGVFTDLTSNIKQSIRGGSILPALALVDPLLCVDCPVQVTVNSGLDALTQGVESYISRNANNATRALALEGVRLINNAIERVVVNGHDLAGRSDMSEGTMLGAMAFAVSGLGAVHGLAHPVGAVTHLPHGMVCGRLLPVVLKWNLPVCRGEMDTLALALGLKDAEDLIRRTEMLLDKFGVEKHFSRCGLQEKDILWIVKNSRSGSMRANPRDLSDEDLAAIVREIL